MERIAKPPELLALFDVSAELFATLQRWFDVPEQVALDLSDVDAAVAQMGDPVAIAALAMRKLQALRLLAQPGVRTSTDVVVTIVQDLDRALIQAPTMRLRRAAQTADWDAELAELLDAPADPEASAGTERPPAPRRPIDRRRGPTCRRTRGTPRPATPRSSASASSTGPCTPPRVRSCRPRRARSASSSERHGEAGRPDGPCASSAPERAPPVAARVGTTGVVRSPRGERDPTCPGARPATVPFPSHRSRWPTTGSPEDRP